MIKKMDMQYQLDKAMFSIVNTVDWKLLNSSDKGIAGNYLMDVANLCFKAGWNTCKDAKFAASEIKNNQLYRDGAITSFDGLTFSHGGTTWLNVCNEAGHKSTFNLRNLPNYTSLQDFLSKQIVQHDLRHIADLDRNFKIALELISRTIENVYWLKVASSIKSYYKEKKLKVNARKILIDSGLSLDDVDALIELPSDMYD